MAKGKPVTPADVANATNASQDKIQTPILPQSPPVNLSGGGNTPVNPAPTVSAPDTSTLAGRLAMANIPPPMIAGEHPTANSLQLADEVRAIMEGQNASRNIQTDAAIQQNVAAQKQQETTNLLTKLQTTQPQTTQEIRGGLLPTVSNVVGALPTAATQGVVGAGGGAVVGAAAAGVGSIPGAIGGGIGGIINGLYSGLKSQAQQDTEIQTKGFSSSLKNIRAIIYSVNHGADPVVAQQLYDIEIAKIAQEERNLKALSERDWLTKAKSKLITINAFNDGQKQKYDLQMAMATASPNPNAPIDAADYTAGDAIA